MTFAAKEESRPPQFAGPLDIWGALEKFVELPPEAAVNAVMLSLDILNPEASFIHIDYYPMAVIPTYKDSINEERVVYKNEGLTEEVVKSMISSLSHVVDLPQGMIHLATVFAHYEVPQFKIKLHPVLK